MTAGEFLQDAATIVRDRSRTYGHPGEMFERVAVRWSRAHDPGHLDSPIDIAGCTTCPAEVRR